MVLNRSHKQKTAVSFMRQLSNQGGSENKILGLLVKVLVGGALGDRIICKGEHNTRVRTNANMNT